MALVKKYNKRDDFDFDKVNIPFFDSDGSRCPSYGVCISQLIRFARARSLVTLMFEIKVKQPNFYSRVIDIINYEIPSQNFITDTMNLFFFKSMSV